MAYHHPVYNWVISDIQQLTRVLVTAELASNWSRSKHVIVSEERFIGHSFFGYQTKKVHLGQNNHESFSNLQAHLSTVCDRQNHLSPWVERCYRRCTLLGWIFLDVLKNASLSKILQPKRAVSRIQPQELELISTWTVQTDLFSKYWHVIFFGAPHPTSTYGTPTLLFKSWGPDPSTWVDPVTRSSLDFMLNTTWAPATYERSCNPYKWPHKWVTRVITPIFGVILGASPS